MYFSLPDEFLYPVVKKDDLDIEEDLVRGTDIEPISEEAEEVKEIEEREDNSSSESFEDIDEEYASSEEGSTRGEDIVEEVDRTEVLEEQEVVEVVEVVGEVQQASIEENIDEEE